MTERDDLFQQDPHLWLQGLASYQQRQVESLLGGNTEYEDAAERWLSGRFEHTAPLGAIGHKSLYKDKLWGEIEKFLCGDESYEQERAKLQSQKSVVHGYVVGCISAAIAPAIGSSGVFLAPAVALLLATVGTVSLRAWCETRKETRGETE